MLPLNQRGLALDVGGTSVKSAWVAPGGKIIGRSLLTPLYSSADKQTLLANFSSILSQYFHEIDRPSLIGIAFSFPGPFDYQAGVCLIKGLDKFESLYKVALGQELRQRLNLGQLPILFRPDAECAVTGEALYGAGRPYQRLLGITLGTGIGSAFMAAGKIVVTGAGVPPNGSVYCLPYNMGIADETFSKRGLEARFRAAGSSVIDVQQAAQSARQGRSDLKEVFATFGRNLAEFLFPMVRDFQAEAVLVQGRISGAMDLFGPELSKGLAVPTLPGVLGTDAGLLGAAAGIFYKESS